MQRNGKAAVSQPLPPDCCVSPEQGQFDIGTSLLVTNAFVIKGKEYNQSHHHKEKSLCMEELEEETQCGPTRRVHQKILLISPG